MARLKKHGVKIRNIDRGVPTRVNNLKKKPANRNSMKKVSSSGPHSPSIRSNKKPKIDNFFKKQAKKKNKMLMNNSKGTVVLDYFDNDVLLVKSKQVNDVDFQVIYNNYVNLLYNVEVGNCSFIPYNVTQECSMNIQNIRRISKKYNINKFDFNISDEESNERWYKSDKKIYDWLFNFADYVIGEGQMSYTDIADCVGGCGDWGQGTHSDNPGWRRDCMKACVDAVREELGIY